MCMLGWFVVGLRASKSFLLSRQVFLIGRVVLTVVVTLASGGRSMIPWLC
jgi:hypothetical protein